MAKVDSERETISGMVGQKAPDGMGGYDLAQCVLNVDSFGNVSVIIRTYDATRLKEWIDHPEVDEEVKANLWYLERLTKEFDYRSTIVAEQLRKYIKEL